MKDLHGIPYNVYRFTPPQGSSAESQLILATSKEEALRAIHVRGFSSAYEEDLEFVRNAIERKDLDPFVYREVRSQRGMRRG